MVKALVAVLLGLVLGVGVLALLGRGPFTRGDGANSTKAQYQRDWASVTASLEWPGASPSAPPYVDGSPSRFGRTVAETAWFCAWSRSWLDGKPSSSQRAVALDHLTTWTKQHDLWLTGETIEPALAQAAAGRGDGLSQIVMANCR